jgi:hypothetical protein
MKLPLIAVITLLGIGMGFATLVGAIPRGFELPLWLVIALLAAILIGRISQRRFLNGFLAGLLSGLASPIVILLFFDSYLAKNPAAAQTFSSLPAAGMSPRLFMAILSPIIAICYGLAVGLLAMLAGKVLGRKAPAAA